MSIAGRRTPRRISWTWCQLSIWKVCGTRTDGFTYVSILPRQVGGESIGGVGEWNSEAVANDVAKRNEARVLLCKSQIYINF